MKSNLVAFLLLICIGSNNILAENFSHPSVLSFETGIQPAIAGKNSTLTISSEHFKHLNNSLKWSWNAPSAQWSIRQLIPYHLKKSNDNAVSTFVFWIYATKPLSKSTLRIEFLKNGRVCSWFDYGLNFSGWRGAWIAFDRDMQGEAEEGMDEMRVTAPSEQSGELFFDHLILAVDEDSRQHTADLQAPFINPKTDNHWLILLHSWNKIFDIQSEKDITSIQKTSLSTIDNRLRDFLLDGKRPLSISSLENQFKEYEILTNADGTIRGIPVFFERFGETYESLGAPDYKSMYNNASGLSNTNDLLLNMAVTYNKSTNEELKGFVAKMFVLLMRHLLDQGFQAGSAMGTLHHLGYSMRNFYTAAFLMKYELQKANLDVQVQQAMEWFAGTGELKTRPEESGMDIDAFNTSLVGRLASILMMQESPDKVKYMTAAKRWIDNGFLLTEGTKDAFKPEGSIFHHRANYPAYAIGGLDGAVTANYLLYGTEFQLAPVGRTNLKNALLAMRNYCNLQTWPLSLSGRHPDGKGHLIPEHFAIEALTGSPDYTDKIDKELAATYLRLETKANTNYKKIFTQQGIEPEKSPNGNWSYNYSCLNVHRRADWMVTAMGHSRYLWATETYPGANMYGRYLNYGNLQITATGNPISNFGSGFNQHGWDWNHFPGTTATVLPFNELRANVKNNDSNSGFEEMLLSDEAFAGGLSFQGKQGIFAMKLHENPKYGGSLRARKSYFFFDNRIVTLGSGISSGMQGTQVQTTLFQVYLPDTSISFNVNGLGIKDFPYKKEFSDKLTMLSDGYNNYFFVKNGEVEFKKSLQYSFDEENEKPTQNNFALASINHGETPKKGSYNYLILVQPDKNNLNQTYTQLKSASGPYEVIRQDSMAHIVKDKATDITGYVFFEPTKLTSSTSIISASLPCLIMEKVTKNVMSLSVADPDLHFYDGKADIQYDKNGNQVERSIYSMSWINNPSAKSEIEVILRGKWKVIGITDFFSVKSIENGNTILHVKCQHGFSRECILQQL